MPYYKAPNNSLHFLDSVEHKHLLPSEFVEITDAEATAIRASEQASIEASKTYVQKRVAEYPPITDYLDGIVKADQAQIAKYIADCQAVKAKYPKV
jgi:hypothetical protein